MMNLRGTSQLGLLLVNVNGMVARDLVQEDYVSIEINDIWYHQFALNRNNYIDTIRKCESRS